MLLLNLGVPPLLSAIPPFQSFCFPLLITHICMFTQSLGCLLLRLCQLYSKSCVLPSHMARLFSLSNPQLSDTSHHGWQKDKVNMTCLFSLYFCILALPFCFYLLQLLEQRGRRKRRDGGQLRWQTQLSFTAVKYRRDKLLI